MPGRDQPAGWMCCVQLLVMPWRLTQAAFSVRAITAAIWGAATTGWITGTLFLYIAVGVSEPWGTWSGVYREMLDSLGLSIFIAGVVLVFYMVWFWPYYFFQRSAHRPIVIALSPVCVVVPYTVWIIAQSMSLSTDVMNERNTLNVISEMPVVQFAGSCMWFPVLLLSWAVNLIVSIRSANKIARDRDRSICICGYDLRGNLAGGSADCPECGLAIPDAMRVDPPSISPDG
jgi:hypothetical protein